MDKEQISVEYAKIYFSAHGDQIPKDAEKAFEVIHHVQKMYKNKLFKDIHSKTEKFVDKYFEDKSDKYL